MSRLPPLRDRQGKAKEAAPSDAGRRRVLKAGIVATTAAIAPSVAGAADAPLTEGPFVEHRLALQLSDRDAAKQTLVLSVAYNMLKEYTPDRVAIEVVAFGPGIDLLRENSENRPRVDSLVSQSVRFSVCMNTVETVERETGAPVALNPHAIKVQAGVARILSLTERGYTLVRP